ncbi:MAG: hypothetical protein RL477_1538 [Pseudomonadota bacterium]
MSIDKALSVNKELTAGSPRGGRSGGFAQVFAARTRPGLDPGPALTHHGPFLGVSPTRSGTESRRSGIRTGGDPLNLIRVMPA